MGNPEISVVIPTYNMRKSIKDLLVSLEAQTQKSFEVIIVDNGTSKAGQHQLSTITQNMTLNIHIVTSELNLGAGRGRNLGVKSAKGRIIAFTDDDCIVGPNWVDAILSAYKENPDRKVLFGPVSSEIKPYYPFIHAFDFTGQVFGSGNCAFIHEFFKAINGFDEYVNSWAEDFEIGAKSELNGQKPIYIEAMQIDHPPKLWNYTMKLGLYPFKLLDIHHYLTKVKNYEYKDNIYTEVYKKCFIKLVIISLILAIPIPIALNLLAVIALFSSLGIRKVVKLKSIIKNYPFENKISSLNFIYYILTSWTIDLLNTVTFISYKLIRLVLPFKLK